jgi:hypothetical protein
VKFYATLQGALLRELSARGALEDASPIMSYGPWQVLNLFELYDRN